MADITVTDREVNSFFVQAGGICLVMAVGFSAWAVYEFWTEKGNTEFGDLMSTAAFLFLCIGLLFVHAPKESMYEKKEEEEQD